MTDKELMQLALYALGLAKSSHNMMLSSDPPQSAWRYYDVDRKLQETITALDKRLEQPEPVTGNLLEDAYNAMVEKKTRSQKLREAGFTRRPKGWEKEKDEQEPVAHTLNCVCGAVWDIKNDGVEEMVHTPDTPPPQHMTPQAYLYICDGNIDDPVLTHKKMDWPEKYSHWQEIPLVMAQRPWVGLTDEELSELSASGLELWELWRAIEAKLRSKNT